MMEKRVYSHTEALCPRCRRKVQARIVRVNRRVEMEKFCPDHGFSSVLISTDVDWYEQSRRYVKPKQKPLDVSVKDYRGCPDSCGMCPEHQQHTCLPVVEITGRCNLDCPICLKNRSVIPDMSVAEFGLILDTLLRTEGKIDVLNLSGGEPTMHPDLAGFLECAATKGVIQTTVSTNGRELFRRKRQRDLFKKYDAIVALQFDGFSRDSYQTLRGVDLSDEKRSLIEMLESEGIKYSLVSTVASGINEAEIAGIVDFFFRSKALSLMLQPATFTGSAAALKPAAAALTIADVVREAGKSSFVRPGDFNPLPCSHYSCFALSYYFAVEPGSYTSLKQLLGEERYLETIANRTLPGLDRDGLGLFKERLYEMWSAADSAGNNEKILKRIKSLLSLMNDAGFDSRKAMDLGFESMKSVFIHHFMDLDTMDLGRLIRCCNVYPQKDGRLIPMCAQNVFFQEEHEQDDLPAADVPG
jgi:7,8-dihydro-6-hydroxymethylpterin dimethyltransferase